MRGQQIQPWAWMYNRILIGVHGAHAHARMRIHFPIAEKKSTRTHACASSSRLMKERPMMSVSKQCSARRSFGTLKGRSLKGEHVRSQACSSISRLLTARPRAEYEKTPDWKSFQGSLRPHWGTQLLLSLLLLIPTAVSSVAATHKISAISATLAATVAAADLAAVWCVCAICLMLLLLLLRQRFLLSMRRCTSIHVLLFFTAAVAAAADAAMAAVGDTLVAAAAATATAFATAITAGLLWMFCGTAGTPNPRKYNTKQLRLAKDIVTCSSRPL